LLIWWTPLCRMLQIMTRRFTLYAYIVFVHPVIDVIENAIQLTDQFFHLFTGDPCGFHSLR
ncbi:hypothetical protein ACTZM9_27895, partial [Klebsiella pneumoniae]